MSGKNRGAKAASQTVVDSSRKKEADVAPPQKSMWQLVVSSVLVAVWLIFLAWMAFTG
jgi:hypothetical protein